MDLAERMKRYEESFRFKLPIKCPLIIRIDGRAFHSLNLEKPFDSWFIETMIGTAFYTFNNVQNAKLAYTQSDEISLLMIDYTANETQPWFDNNLAKIVSISAGLASSYFTHFVSKIKRVHKNMVEFDSRAFILPQHEVENYFLWRWRDCVKNSVLSVAQKHFSTKMLLNKKQEDQHEMLHKIGVNWATDFNDHEKNGSIITSEGVLSAPDSTEKWRELVRKEVYIDD